MGPHVRLVLSDCPRDGSDSVQAILVKLNANPKVELALDMTIIVVNAECRPLWRGTASGQIPEDNLGLDLGDRELSCNLPTGGKRKQGIE